MSETKTEPGFIDFLSKHVQFLRRLEATLIESNKNLEEAIKNMENKRNFKKKVYIKILIIYFMTKMAKKTSKTDIQEVFSSIKPGDYDLTNDDLVVIKERLSELDLEDMRCYPRYDIATIVLEVEPSGGPFTKIFKASFEIEPSEQQFE